MSDDPPSYRLAFPGLTDDNHIQTSLADDFYNCMGHATNTYLWWNPTSSRGGEQYWPPGAPRENTVEAYQKTFELLGYKVCQAENFEIGFDKIAVFTKNNLPTHVTRQLDEKFWTSKLGKGVDISHELRALCGYNFGEITIFMKRPKR